MSSVELNQFYEASDQPLTNVNNTDAKDEGITILEFNLGDKMVIPHKLVCIASTPSSHVAHNHLLRAIQR